MFDNLTDRLQGVFRKLKGLGKISEENVQDAMKEVKMALLEADVNFKVVRDFVAAVKEKALGAEVLKSLTPGQQFIKIVHDELVRLMGDKVERIIFPPDLPMIIMLVGLQGSGKTTTCGKLAKYFQKEQRKPMMVACDIYRPAAVKQLQVLGESLGIPVFSMGTATPVKEIAMAAMVSARKHGSEVVIFDTAGRLHIDVALMKELEDLKAVIKPHEIFLVIDAMSGQDAVNVSREFDAKLDISGAILTKLDGDARGGSALSVRAVTGKPIKLIGMGEKLEALELFHPDRMASRILGMGDVLTLIEKVEQTMDREAALKMEQKLRRLDFNLEDFLEQMKQLKRMGPLQDILSMIPGMGNAMPKGLQVDDSQMKRVEALILSMTPAERRNPRIVDGSRRRRIARGSGMQVVDVNMLLARFEEMNKMMKNFSNMQKKMKGFSIPGMGGLKDMMGFGGAEESAEASAAGSRNKGISDKIKQKLKKKKRNKNKK